MTREEAIKTLANATIEPPWGGSFRATSEALDMAIEALKRERTDEWCPGCKEYDMEKKCCPRFNRVIRGAMKRIPHDDGTLEIKVEDATKIGRVLISDDKHRGGLYYPDEDVPQGISFETDTEIKSCSKDSDLISRTEAIEHFMRLSEDESLSPFTQMLMVGASNELKILPSADRPRGEWIPCEERLPSEKKAVLICDSGGNRFAGELILTDTGYKWNIPLFTVWMDIEDGDAWMPLPEPYKESDTK